MIRFLTYLFTGLVLGGIIHLTVILIMPAMSTHNAWAVVERATAPNQMYVLSNKRSKLRSTLNLDPAFNYAICQINLADGPVAIGGKLPTTFWTAALIGQDGSVPYSTNSRTNNHRDFKIGIFNASQARSLLGEDIDIDPNLLIVRTPFDQMTAIIRVLPSHKGLSDAIEDQLSAVTCSLL